MGLPSDKGHESVNFTAALGFSRHLAMRAASLLRWAARGLLHAPQGTGSTMVGLIVYTGAPMDLVEFHSGAAAISRLQSVSLLGRKESIQACSRAHIL